MGRDPRVDAYIDKAPGFARPILRHLRELAHEALPDAGEAIKWGMPTLTLGGRNAVGLAAFKAHCAMVIHGASAAGKASEERGGMGQLGRIRSLGDLPGDAELVRLVREVCLAVPAPRRTAVPKTELAVPDDLAVALVGVDGAGAVFAAFTSAQRRDYIEWIVSAKQPATRARRIDQAVQWIGEGKRRNWKYEKC